MQNITDYEKAYPLLTMAVKAIDWDSGERDSAMVAAMMAAGGDSAQMAAVEVELAGLTVPQLHALINADPGEVMPFAPLASVALTDIFE